jgi:hypothetical protein
MSINQFSSITSRLSSKIRLSSPTVVTDDGEKVDKSADGGIVREYFNCSQLTLPASWEVNPKDLLINFGVGGTVK